MKPTVANLPKIGSALYRNTTNKRGEPIAFRVEVAKVEVPKTRQRARAEVEAFKAAFNAQPPAAAILAATVDDGSDFVSAVWVVGRDGQRFDLATLEVAPAGMVI